MKQQNEEGDNLALVPIGTRRIVCSCRISVRTAPPPLQVPYKLYSFHDLKSIISRTPKAFFRKLIPCLLFPLIFIVFSTDTLYAQVTEPEHYSFRFQGEPLSKALDYIAREAETDLVYDPGLVEDIIVYKHIQDMTLRESLRSILEDTPLDFLTLSSGTLVIIETVADDPFYGSLAGKIVDSQTGEPLPGATVMLADASGGTSSNRYGIFHMNRMVSGSYSIIFSYIGYEPVYKTIDIPPNQQVREIIDLDPKPVKITPIIVTGHLPQLPLHNNGSESIAPDNAWSAGGEIRDAIRSLNLFSGVQYGLPMTDLHLQGGQQGEHRMLLDGAPVYNPHSFGQMYSAFSPFAINRIQVHKAGYGVQEGSQIAGLINLNHDIPDTENGEGLLQGDLLSLNSRANFSLSAGNEKSIDLMSAVRTHYWNIYQAPYLEQTLRDWDEVDPLITNVVLHPDREPPVYQTLKHSPEVRFHDFHLASRYEIDPLNTLKASIYKGGNYVNTDLLAQSSFSGDSPEYMYARDRYQWSNFMGQLTYNGMVSARLDVSLQASYSSNNLNHRYQIGNNNTPAIPDIAEGPSISIGTTLNQFRASSEQIPVQEDQNRIQHMILRGDFGYSISPVFQSEAGIQIDRVASRVNFSDLFYLLTLSTEKSTLLGIYVNNKLRAGEHWRFDFGSRFTWQADTNQFYPEPRGSIQVDRSDSNIGYWSFRVAGGLYRQFINQLEITNPGPTALVPSFSVWSHSGLSEPPKAYHISGSLFIEPDERTTVKLESFHKWQPTTYITSYNNLLTGYSLNRSQFEAFAESSSMRAYGVGIRLNRDFMAERLQLMAGYDYSVSKINMESQFGRTLPAPWNEPHRLQARLVWHAHPVLTLVAKWHSILDRKWAFRQAYYDYLLFRTEKEFGGYSFNSPENDRLPAFHQFDLSFIYKPSVGFSDLEIRLELMNLLNRYNAIDQSLVPSREAENEYEIRERTLPGFTPSVSIQLNF